MTRMALRGLLARKLRTALTGFAVVIGVAFVAGTFIFTDTINASFDDLFERVAKGAGRKVVGFSAETGEGRRELWGALRRLTLGTPVSGSANENESNEASEADGEQAGGAEA